MTNTMSEAHDPCDMASGGLTVVTPAMIAAGTAVYEQWWPEKLRRGHDRKADLVSRVFRAMSSIRERKGLLTKRPDYELVASGSIDIGRDGQPTGEIEIRREPRPKHD